MKSDKKKADKKHANKYHIAKTQPSKRPIAKKQPAKKQVAEKPVGRRRVSRLRTAIVYLLRGIIKLLILAAVAIFAAWLTEYRHFINDADRAWQFVAERPLVFWYTALILFFVILGIYGIFRKIGLAAATMVATVLVVGYIHIAKFNFRGSPLLPEDFQLGSQAGTLTKFIDPWEIVRLVIAVIMVFALGVIFDRITSNWLQRKRTAKKNIWWYGYRLTSRIAIIAIAVAGFLAMTDFARNHENEREIKVEFLSSRFIDWNQTENYTDNGFLIGFLYNISKLEVTEPNGYSKEKVAEIKSELDAKKSTADESGDLTSLKNAGYNIVLVLNESFFDPENIRNVYNYDGGDVTPNLHRLQNTRGVLSGTMYSVDYGGGTANIEFEILTGLTNYFLKTVPYTNLLPYQKSIPSIASFAKENGYKTTAMHPFNGGMYKREIVLPRMGFDEFITEQDFEFTEKDGSSEYINDRSSYNQALKVLADSSEPQLISLVTMQNHAPYEVEEYGKSKFNVTNLEPGTERSAIETYLMTMNSSDQYLGEFYEKVMALDEPTVVLFYGDHSAGVFPRVIESEDYAISSTARQTPYLLFSNFEMKNAPVLAKSATALETNELPTTTPNCLANTMLNVLKVEKPTLNYLLDTICKDEPILTDAYFNGATPFMSSELSAYEILSYDITAGKQYYLKD